MKKAKETKEKKSEKQPAAQKQQSAPKQPEPRAERPSANTLMRFLRISPRKVRLVIDAVRFKPVQEAAVILANMNKKAARMAAKALKSAVANAKVKGLDENKLYISDVRANGGPVFKRFMSRSMGRADRLLKRTTHLSLAVSAGERVYRDTFAPAAAAEDTQEKSAPKAKRTRAKKSAAGKK